MPTAAQQRVKELLESGRLFRYQGGAGDVAELERDFSKYIGLPYTVACNSGGCGLFLALRALGVKPGDRVLLNAWTLAPVPGAVVHACAEPVFVATDPEKLTVDIQDLEAKATESGAKVLLLSYMRGHVPHMDRVMEVCRRYGLLIVEDCAHTLGAKWKLDSETTHRHLGTFGDVGVWSLQTNKTINCGEGGLISTRRQDLASFITIATGSYGLYQLNGASGDVEQLRTIYATVPNMSMRLTTIAAALAKTQLETISLKLAAWARHAFLLRRALKSCPHTRTVKQEACLRGKEICVWSSIQFELIDFDARMVEDTLQRLGCLGIPAAWFGGPCSGFTSTLKDWKFADPAGEQWKETIASTVKSLVDLPLYHTATWSDVVIARLADVLIDTITSVVADAGRKGSIKAGSS